MQETFGFLTTFTLDSKNYLQKPKDKKKPKDSKIAAIVVEILYVPGFGT